MSEPVINKVMRFRKEALFIKTKMEKSKLHKIKLIFLPTYQKRFIIACAIIETCNQLLDMSSNSSTQGVFK